MHQDSWKKMIC